MRASDLILAGVDRTRFVLGVDDEGRWAEPRKDGPVTDLSEWVAIPGLVDGHAHLTSTDVAEMHGPVDEAVRRRIVDNAGHQLAGGVLLVADKGTHDAATVEVTLGVPVERRPEVSAAGRFFASPGGYFHGVAAEVDRGGLAAAVTDLADDASEWVKVIGDWPRRGVGAIPSFDETDLRGAVEAAHRRGRRVAIHAAAPQTPGFAVRAGVDSIEHGLFLTEDDIALLGSRGGAWVPTIAAMERLADQLGHQSSGGRLILEGLDNVRARLAGAADAGVCILAGTDLALRHGAVVDEGLRLLAYGLGESDVVAALTHSGRRYLGRSSFGQGDPADLVLVDTPGAVADLSAPRLVLRHGVVVVDTR